MAGLIAVNVNPLYTPRELELQLQDSGAVAIVSGIKFCFYLGKSRFQYQCQTRYSHPNGRSTFFW